MSDQEIARMVRRGDPDRYFSALFAPESLRRHLMTLYAFNHEVARVGETVRQPLMGEIRLQWWRETLIGAKGGTPRNHELARALADLFSIHELPLDLFEEMLDARTFDSSEDQFADWPTLETYCDRTSGNLMRLAARVLGAGSEYDGLAREAGLAYAIAGLIRALPYHAGRHKVYLPNDLLGAVGLSPDRILSGTFDEKVRAAVAQTALKAKEHLLAARQFRSARTVLPAFLPAALVPLYLRRAGRRAFKPLTHSGDVSQQRKQMALLSAALLRRI